MGSPPATPAPGREHGPHTLQVRRGQVVGVFGRDVFVELGPRVQGVLSVDQFDGPPEIGESHDFTLRGQEEGLWVLCLEREPSLATWEDMEVGCLVHARVVRPGHGGLEAKVGPLHAFLPRSQTGLARGRPLDELVGRTIACEVIEIDAGRQRVLLSRKIVQKREKLSARQRAVGSLAPGQIVQGRVTRVERYGAFVSLGRGLEGLVHVSDLAWERPADATDVVARGDTLKVKVLAIRREGKRIALGVKQTEPSPWAAIDPADWVGRIRAGQVTRVVGYGAFVRVASGIEGLLHVSETGLEPGRAVDELLREGAQVAVRVVAIDPERERLSLSLTDTSGARLAAEEAEPWTERLDPAPARLESSLGSALDRALTDPPGSVDPAEADGPAVPADPFGPVGPIGDPIDNGSSA